MAEKKLVQVKVDSDRLEAWDEYWQEDPEFSDRSDLVRKSVERTISPDTDEDKEQNTIGRQEALQRFERIENLLNDLEREVGIAQDDIVNADQMDDIVLQRSYRAIKKVLEDTGVLDNDGE